MRKARAYGRKTMSESCNRRYKSFCFQCGEEDCEKYQPNPPEWIEKLREDDDLMQLLEKMKEANNG
jgi:hypothetical protein